MIFERTEHPAWLSNAYLVAEGPSGRGVLVDGNGVAEPLVERIERERIEVTHILVTHRHADHVEGVEGLAQRFGVPVLGFDRLADGEVVRSGELEIEALFTPGHATDHVAFLVDGSECLTGDALFRRTVGGTRGGGPTGFVDLKGSIMERLLTLPPETRVHPGHREPTRVGEEWAENPFVRLWRGLDPEGAEPCRVRGVDATLVLWARDYDGGHKAWVRFPSGEDAIVGGSQVERLSKL
ncbi:MAG: MBL fold metallo-hydrolase [Actinomycetota bacterium]|nr:MBL fold metallo-hydrolase [Actinomycetota bacterium]